MTTVGYGDFYPRTFIGRILDIIIAIWGGFIISMMVVVLSSTLESKFLKNKFIFLYKNVYFILIILILVDSSEKRALKVLQRLEVRKELRKKAAYLLTGIATFNFLEKKKKKLGTL